MKKILPLAAVGLLLLPSASRAVDLTIADALKTALQNSPTLKSERQELNKAQGTLVQARGNFLPSISLSAEYTDERYPSVTSTGRSDSRSAGVTLTENLYAGGKYAAQRRQAKSTLTKAGHSIREAEEALAVDIYSSFYGVLLARETVAAAADAVETSRRHVQEVHQMLRLGLANQLEVIRAEQQLSSNEASLAAGKSALDTSRINLFNLMGLPPNAQLSPIGELELPEPQGSATGSVEAARKQRADLALLKNQISIQHEQIKIARSDMKPSLSFSATAEWVNPYHYQDHSEDSWEATLSLNIPVFDRGQTRGEVMKAKAEQEQNYKALEQKELDVLSEIELAWAEIGETAVQIESWRKALTLAKETLRLSQVGYREGVTPQLDLLEAQSDLTAARKDYSQSLYDHLMKVVALKRAEGALIPWTLEGMKK